MPVVQVAEVSTNPCWQRTGRVDMGFPGTETRLSVRTKPSKVVVWYSVHAKPCDRAFLQAAVVIFGGIRVSGSAWAWVVVASRHRSSTSPRELPDIIPARQSALSVPEKITAELTGN